MAGLIAKNNRTRPYSIFKLEGMTKREKIQFSLLLLVGMLLTVSFAVWWFEPWHVAHNFTGPWHVLDFVFFIVLTYVVWHFIIMEVFSWYVATCIRQPAEPRPPEDNLRVAYMTAFVPGSEPHDILENTLRAMVEVDYPHDTWLLDEGDDEQAKQICQKYGVKYYTRKGKQEFNTTGGKFAQKTKGGNYNSWLHHYGAEYDILAQHDVDFIPRKDFLIRTLGYFRDPQIAFVGTPQVYGNIQESWIARGAAEQTYGFYGFMQKGFYGHNMTLLIGANHLMRIKAYEDIDGYTAHIAEDMLTGMKLYTHKNDWKSVYVPEALLIGEGPATYDAYLSQQMRWAYGCMDIVFRHAPNLLPKMNWRKTFNYIVLQQFYFSGVAQVGGIILLCLYFFSGLSSANLPLLPILWLYLPLVIFQILFELWLQRFNVRPEIEKGLLLRARLLSLAAWPIFFLAFIGVVRGKKLTYVVTPKGSSKPVHMPALFVPHLILGSLTLLAVLVGVIFHRLSGPMIFWALLNTVFMYYFFWSEALPAFWDYWNSKFGKLSASQIQT